MVDFSLTDEQRALQGLAREFARKEIVPIAAALDREHRFPRELLEKAHQTGLMNVVVPPEYGGRWKKTNFQVALERARSSAAQRIWGESGAKEAPSVARCAVSAWWSPAFVG